MSSSPEKKRKKTTTADMSSPILPPTLQSTPIPSLPNDLLMSCLARVSRLHYPTLSLVSKRFRSLLASPELHEARSLLGHTESCLYLCLKFPHDPNPRWFTLCRKPNRTLINATGKKPSGNVLAPITVPHSPLAHWKGRLATAVVGSSIYAIGGGKEEAPSSKVSVLDCRSHTWREGPSMAVKRSYPEANVVDGKIYVTGRSDQMEVFDPKTEAWESVSCPYETKCSSLVNCSRVIDGRIYYTFGYTKCVAAYKPKEDKWEAMIERHLNLGCKGGVSWCTIGDVLYCYSWLNGFQWYDSEMRGWRLLKGYVGLESLPKFFGYFVQMVDYGGKIAILWVPCRQNTTMWCAVIALKRRNSEEMWGNVEWFDAVLQVPPSFEFVSALAATL